MRNGTPLSNRTCAQLPERTQADIISLYTFAPSELQQTPKTFKQFLINTDFQQPSPSILCVAYSLNLWQVFYSDFPAWWASSRLTNTPSPRPFSYRTTTLTITNDAATCPATSASPITNE